VKTSTGEGGPDGVIDGGRDELREEGMVMFIEEDLAAGARGATGPD